MKEENGFGLGWMQDKGIKAPTATAVRKRRPVETLCSALQQRISLLETDLLDRATRVASILNMILGFDPCPHTLQ
jgi:hypothetical protein